MLLVWEILWKCQTWAKTHHLCGGATRITLGGPTSWVEWGLKESPGRVNSDRQVDGDSDLALACQLCGGVGGHQRNYGFCQHFCLGENCQIIQFFPLCPWCLSSCWPGAGAQCKGIWVSPRGGWGGSLRGMLGFRSHLSVSFSHNPRWSL